MIIIIFFFRLAISALLKNCKQTVAM